MKYLSTKEILDIHKEIERIYRVDPTVLLPSNLEIAEEAPKTMIFGTEIYRTVSDKAAAYMYNLIKLSPFVDGNKRTGLLATIQFLEQNGRRFLRNIEDEVETSIETAKCNINTIQLSDWIKRNSRRKD